MDQFMQTKTSNPLTAGGQSTTSANSGQPYVRIVEQPAKCALRFRYECEGRSAGSIPGQSATADNKTYPSIQVCNHRGQAVVVVSCVTKEQPYRPHPHNLVGKEGCKKGVCTMVINNQDMVCTFTSLGIQCVKRKDIEDSLKLRETIKVDPYRTGFGHRSQSSSIDLNVVRLCFQVFIEGPEKDKFNVQLPPIVSEPIYDKKAMTELIITKLSHCSAPCNGGKEVILLCDRVAKDDIQVRFIQEMNGQILWEGFADFGPGDVHKQVAICFRTPRYFSESLTQPVAVQLQLRRPSDGCLSDPRSFQIMPIEADPDGLTRKRQKLDEGCLERFLRDNQLFPVSASGGTGIAQRAVSPVSPKRDVIHVPRMSPTVKLEPMTTTIDTQQLIPTSSQSSWSPNSQYMPLTQTQQTRPQLMDGLLSQDFGASQLSSQMSTQQSSQCSTQSDFILPDIPLDINSTKSQTSTTLTPLLQAQAVLDRGIGIDIGAGIYDTNTMQTNSNLNTNQLNLNCNQLNDNQSLSQTTDEVMEKFDSLGLDIDTSELLSDIHFTPSMMSVMMDSGNNIGLFGNSRENLLNSRDNILVSSSLQTPDLTTSGGGGGGDDNVRNMMANPQQMQSLRSKLIQLESNNNSINNNNIHLNATNDKINNN